MGVKLGLSVIVFISKKSLRNDSNRIFNFFLLMVFNLLPSYFLLGILFFTILYSNSSYGEKEAINQRAIFTRKVRRVSRSNSVFCYSFYLPNMKRNVMISSRFDYDWKDKTACGIYLHKGYFGMYVVDSAVYKENQYYSTTLVAEWWITTHLYPNLLLPSLGGVGGGFYLYKLVPLLYLYFIHIFPYQCRGIFFLTDK